MPRPRRHPLILPVPALPTDRFPAFKDFVTTPAPGKEWPCGADRPWTFADAARVAVSVAHALGAFGVVSAPVADLEDEAFAWWLSLPPDERLTESRRAVLLAEQHDQQPAAFAFDSRAFGFDQAPWALTDGGLVRHLNAWCRTALAAFYAATEDPAQLQLALAASEDPPAPDPEIPPAPEGITEERWRVIRKSYNEHVSAWRAAHGRAPLRNEDMSPEVCRAVGVTRPEMRVLRVAWRKKICRAVARPC